jgi:hypothetical protein
MYVGGHGAYNATAAATDPNIDYRQLIANNPMLNQLYQAGGVNSQLQYLQNYQMNQGKLFARIFTLD